MQEFRGFDGLSIAYQELGEGRPVVLLHGVMGVGSQWIDQGPARMIADSGFRVILPDLRGHGASARPHDPAAYPPDVLADDGLALVEHLGLDDYDLGGYSLGGRVTLRMLVRGARPRRAVIAGQGLDAVEGETSRTGGYRRTLTAIATGGELDQAGQQTKHWLDQLGQDPNALLHVLDTHVATPLEALAEIDVPTLVAIGADDRSHASADRLAAALPSSRYVRVPGDHWSAFAGPEFGSAVLGWLRNISAM
ncbi:alpha/beta fold hydrolase [Kutzneria sp. CA-103260]|uniref:alpha/beta fold hydrolase n=1 Tax=Kutzneria sp. CA-103260 TaxID=2802641 RepID=UPI001BA4B853|nr:alpha/beta hydrolase [Kutzneria sp. CA-103260]QUQ65967.1 alpha/beta hydrolase [Kutzneria sp. CA-103260]